MTSKVYHRSNVVWLALMMASGTGQLLAQYDPQAAEPLAKLRGALLLHGGGPVSAGVIDRFVELAGGKQAKIVIVPTASADPGGEAIQHEVDEWRKRTEGSVTLLHAATREEALAAEFVEPLKHSTGVWFCGGQQSRLAEGYAGTPVEQALRDVIDRGGVVGGTGAGAAALSKVMIAGGEDRAEIGSGLGLLPGTLIDPHFLTRDRQPRMMNVLESRPGLVGLGIDEGTSLVVRGRSLTVFGESCAVVCLAASRSRPQRVERLMPGKSADLIALSRAAVARSLPEFPPAEPPPPEVANGTLVIVGGGGMPKGLMERFVELSGGKEAEIVYIPCTEQETIDREPEIVNSFRRLNVKRAGWLHTKDRQKASVDDEFLAPLTTATGIFFGGGRQWNLVDSYQNTRAHKLMHDVLARGGVIGGSSAGASIQGDYMPRGDPLGNLNIIAEGYERGLGFLTGVAIDQHFTQRKRLGDMTLLMKTYPQVLGIGVDESTALVVQRSAAEVVGNGRVHFYDYRQPPTDDDHDYLGLSAGQRYDLKARQILPSPK